MCTELSRGTRSSSWSTWAARIFTTCLWRGGRSFSAEIGCWASRFRQVCFLPCRRLTVKFQVTKAVAHCHKKGVLHLDVKPANVLVSRRGVCKLGDFGCSIVTSKKRVSSGNKAFLVGTPGYQAPELLLGKVPTAACDVYSLGLLFWQLDSREVPYARQHPQVYHVTKVAIEVYLVITVTNHPTFHQHFHSDFVYCL